MLYGWEDLTADDEERILRGVKDGRPYGGPFHVVLYPTNRCNFRCFFCSFTNDGDELEWDILRPVLEDNVAHGLRAVTLSGGGEPLIYRGIDNLWNFMREHSIRLYDITTNGSELTPDVTRTLVDLGLRWLTISLNETTSETHTKMCGSSPEMFERVIAGIRNGIQARDATNSNCEVRAQVMLWKKNFTRLGEMMATAFEAGADYVYVNTIDSLKASLRLTDSEREECKGPIEEAIRRWGARLQFRVFQEGLQEYVQGLQVHLAPEAIRLPDICDTPDRIEYCNVGWYSLTLVANGDVYPCCNFTCSPQKTVGNIHNEPLQAIWKGERMQAFRSEMRHLLLTAADKESLPQQPCFIDPICVERAACPINFYLSSPDFYGRVHDWAENGPRAAYQKRQRVKARMRSVLGWGRKRTS